MGGLGTVPGGRAAAGGGQGWPHQGGDTVNTGLTAVRECAGQLSDRRGKGSVLVEDAASAKALW